MEEEWLKFLRNHAPRKLYEDALHRFNTRDTHLLSAIEGWKNENEQLRAELHKIQEKLALAWQEDREILQRSWYFCEHLKPAIERGGK